MATRNVDTLTEITMREKSQIEREREGERERESGETFESQWRVLKCLCITSGLMAFERRP